MRATGTFSLSRRVSLAAFLSVLAAARGGSAADARYLRVGTGSVSGTYYPVGELLARIVSTPPGARACDQEGVCGVPDLIVIVQTSKGSVENARAVQAGEIESGFVQSDVAFGAFHGSGEFEGGPPMTRLRALASLYVESAHLVARAGTGIATVADLRGKRVSLDVEGSGTLVEARLILEAYGLGADTIQAVYATPGRALDMMAAGELDAFFLVAGYPAAAVSELVGNHGASLVPIKGREIETLLKTHRFLARDVIPAGTYGQTAAIETVGVAALWLVAADLEDQLVYAITAALWQPAARAELDAGHPKGKSIRLENALLGVALPVHPGAARYYQEHGIAG